jgi:uncharacterized protein YcbX
VEPRYRQGMRVRTIWRHPVKSMQGERLTEASIDDEGIAGDRRYALFDTATGLGLTARRVPELLFARARWQPADGSVQITLPDGSRADDDRALSAWLGRAVELRASRAASARRYENPDDFEDEAAAPWSAFDGAPGAFHDSARARITLVSTTTLGGWDERRFRANVVLDGGGEDDLVGTTIGLGSARLDVRKSVSRCVMVTRAQPDVVRDLDVLRTVNARHRGTISVGAIVVAPGRVAVGDRVTTLGA